MRLRTKREKCVLSFEDVQSRAMQLAEDLSARSTVKIKVGAVLYNNNEIIAWGWNNPGRDGLGEHAEHMAIRRFLRTFGYGEFRNVHVAVYSSRKGKPITSKPCARCEYLLRSWGVAGATYLRKYEREGHYVILQEETEY